MSSYNLLLKSPTGTELSYLNDFSRLEAARAANAVGKAVVDLPSGHLASDFDRDYRLEIWRSPVGGAAYLEGRTYWLVRKIQRTLTDTRWTTRLTLHDTNDILTRRIIDYTRETDYADKLIINGNEGYEDNLLKAYARENLGGLALESARNLSAYLEIEGDRGEGGDANSEKQAAFRSLFQTIKELAQLSDENGVPMFFDTIALPSGKLLFYTKPRFLNADRTKDATKPLVFSSHLGHFKSVEVIRDYTEEITAVTVGGAGTDAGRAIERVTDPFRIDLTPFNRIEMFVDARDWEDPTLLQGEGRARLAQGRPRLQLVAQVLDLPTLRYGIDYHYGDLVTAFADDTQFDCHVHLVKVQVEDGLEELDIRLTSEVSL